MEEKSEKKIRFRSFISGVAVTLVAAALLYFLSVNIPLGGDAKRPDTIQSMRKVKEIQRVVWKNYLQKIDTQKETDNMYAGLIAGLEDPYSHYYTREQYEQLQSSFKGEYTGIGITFSLGEDGKAVIVSAVSENSPAEKAGIQKGDRILSIADRKVDGMTSSEVVRLVQSNAGKNISVILERSGTAGTLKIQVRPDHIRIQTVSGKMLTDKIGYIRIKQFSGTTAGQYKEVFRNLKNQGMAKLIIDLRDNPGGLVDSCCEILRTILPKGIIVYEEDKNGKRKYYEDKDDTSLQMPLAVLTNKNTASASEIFTGAIKDYGIGMIIGTRTFGKGIVQNTYTLSDGSVLQLTTTYYFTPDGHNINKKGIVPDIEVEQGKSGDQQLDKALEQLK